MNEKMVIYKLFSIIKEPRMSAIVYCRGGFPAVAGSRIQELIIVRENLPYSKAGGPAF